SPCRRLGLPLRYSSACPGSICGFRAERRFTRHECRGPVGNRFELDSRSVNRRVPPRETTRAPSITRYPNGHAREEEMTDLAEKLQSERTAPASSSRFDRAWGIVVGAGLLMFVNLGPVLYYTSGIFTKAITDDTGWTRGTIATASVPANLLITLALPLVVWAVDIDGTRRIALRSSILFVVGMFLL